MPRVNELCAALAKEIAKENFEVNQLVYREEAVEHAEKGTTESSYMKGAIEVVEWYVNDQIFSELLPEAEKEYQRLMEETYYK